MARNKKSPWPLWKKLIQLFDGWVPASFHSRRCRIRRCTITLGPCLGKVNDEIPTNIEILLATGPAIDLQT